MPKPLFVFDNTYAKRLDGFYAPVELMPVAAPSLLAFNEPLARELKLDAKRLQNPFGVSVLAGNDVPEGAQPLAQAYAGHQFGGFSPQLGDGRALLLGELVGAGRFDMQLKGSGRTPFSRGGDGRATLSSVLREYLMAEAMHQMGIHTTRALAAIKTGERIRRQQYEQGGVLTRIASSHLRVGTFEYFAARKDHEKVKRLLDYALERHPTKHGRESYEQDDCAALAFLRSVCKRQVQTVTSWLGIGFIHGVMNTDNMTISGETIDYGPCAFMEGFDTATVFSSIDRQGRYAYGRQPEMALFNLARLAETLLPLIESDTPEASVHAILEDTQKAFGKTWSDVLARKLGVEQRRESDTKWLRTFSALLEKESPDFTNTFRTLEAELKGGRCAAAIEISSEMRAFIKTWKTRLEEEEAPLELMQRVNPRVIPRNHLVEEALKEGVAGNIGHFDDYYSVVTNPFDEPSDDRLLMPAPQGLPKHVTFCGT